MIEVAGDGNSDRQGYWDVCSPGTRFSAVASATQGISTDLHQAGKSLHRWSPLLLALAKL